MSSESTAERIRKLERLAERPGTPGEGLAPNNRQASHEAVNCSLRSCRSTKFKVEPGKGPHAHHLRCANCGRGGYWMPGAEAQKFENARAKS